MLTLDKTLKNYISKVSALGTEKINLSNSLNRVLSEDIYSDVDMPPFDKSAMDGYACKLNDLKEELSVIDTIPAGRFSNAKIKNGQCAKIMTGAPIPQGSDCVIMIEHTEQIGENAIKFVKEKTNKNICYRGEDVAKGEKILHKGTLLKARHIPMLASVGISKVPVYSLPKVGIIATGSELVEPKEKPGMAKIRNSNAYQLIAMLKHIGLEPIYYGIIEDNKEKIELSLKKAINENDTVLLTGGVSVGDFDFVPHIIEKLGMEIHFSEVAIKPGKPVVFASSKKKLCFGLSGNPVSSFFQFETLCKPAIFKQMGFEYKPQLFELELTKTIKRKKADRLGLYPVEYVDSRKAEPIEFHGSAHIHALSNAFGIVEIPQGELELKKGTKVNVRPI